MLKLILLKIRQEQFFQFAAARNSMDLFARRLAYILHPEYTYPHNGDEAVTKFISMY
jgi:hypothetical protein